MLRVEAWKDHAHEDSIWTTKFAPARESGEIELATGSVDDTVKVWRFKGASSAAKEAEAVSELELVHNLDAEDSLGVLSVAYDYTGERLMASTMGFSIRSWESVSGKVAGMVQADAMDSWTLAAHPSMTELVATGTRRGAVTLWDVSTGEKRASLESGVDGDGGSFVMGVAFQDGMKVASSGHDGVCRIFDIESGKVVSSIEASGRPLRNLAFDATGNILFTASDDGRVGIWDASSPGTMSSIASLAGHRGWVLSVATSPDENYVVSGAADGTVRLWDVRRRECVSAFAWGTPAAETREESGTAAAAVGGAAGGTQVWSVDFDSTGKHIAAVGDDGRLVVLKM